MRGHQFDHLVTDQRGVDVHHHEPAALPGQPRRGHCDVETGLGCGLGQSRTQVGHLGLGDPELDGGHRLTGQPPAAVDVAPVIGDDLCGSGHVSGKQRTAQQRHHHTLGTRRVVSDALPDLQRHPQPGAGAGQPVGELGDVVRQRTEQQRQDQLFADDDLLEVEHLGSGARDRVHQLNGHAWAVGAGDGGGQRLQVGHVARLRPDR